MSALADKLYKHVQDYFDLGFHRTGTCVDLSTIKWFEQELLGIGARVERVPYEYPHYAAEWVLTVDGQEMKSLPLYYEAVGNFEISSPFIGTIDVSGLWPMGEVIRRQLDAARNSGADGAVLATSGHEGHLVVPNRAPFLGSGFPALLVAGTFLERLQQGNVRASLSAEISERQSSNVIGYVGEGNFNRPVIVTTPLSGWFGCAGERGTGIAIAIELARNLAQKYPVIVIGATGHELEYYGAKKHLETISEKPAAVIHLGASVAAGKPGPDNSLVLSPTRHAKTSADGRIALEIEHALIPGQFLFESESDRFLGEGGEWIGLEMPLLSFAGGFRLFHAPEDVPQNATSPELLGVVCRAVVESSHIFVADAVRR